MGYALAGSYCLVNTVRHTVPFHVYKAVIITLSEYFTAGTLVSTENSRFNRFYCQDSLQSVFT